MNDDGKTDAPPFTTDNSISLALKGAAMGAANVIPGVSGGTIALITGIYADLINTLKSVGWKAVKLFAGGDFRKWFDHLNGPFACAVGLGVVASVFTFANVLEQLLANHETLTMAFLTVACRSRWKGSPNS